MLQPTPGALLSPHCQYTVTRRNHGVRGANSTLNETTARVIAGDEVTIHVTGWFTVMVDQAREFCLEGTANVSREFHMHNVTARPRGYFQPGRDAQNRRLYQLLLPEATAIVQSAVGCVVASTEFRTWVTPHIPKLYTDAQLTAANRFRYRHRLRPASLA